MYGEAGHYYTTYYVAMRVGYTDEQAQKLAFYSQLPDEVDRYDAIGVQADSIPETIMNAISRSTRVDEGVSATEARYPYERGAARDSMQQNLHALTGSAGPTETARTLAAISDSGSDAAATGVLIHRLGDTFAHRSESGRTYESGIGHGARGDTPDVIQRQPGLYLDYAQTLATALATQRGLSASEAQAIAAQVREELGDVAAISTVTPGGDFGPAPSQWMQPAPPDARFPRQRSDGELEGMSVAALREKLAQLGVRQDYAPETLPTGVTTKAARFIPGAFKARTVDQAVDDFRRSGSAALGDDPDSASAVERALRLMEKQRAVEKGEASIIVEDEDG